MVCVVLIQRMVGLVVIHHPCMLCSTLQHTATHCNTLQHTATHCNALQHTATHCNTLQYTATHCSTTCVLFSYTTCVLFSYNGCCVLSSYTVHFSHTIRDFSRNLIHQRDVTVSLMYEMASMSRLLKILGRFCKNAL